MKIDVIIAAAGLSTRFHSDTKKQFYHIGGKPVIQRTIENFISIEHIGRIIVVISEPERAAFARIVSKMDFEPMITTGGMKRADSVLNGLKLSHADCAMVHDGARPFVSEKLINSIIESYRKNTIIVPAITPYETVRYIKGDLQLLNRNNVYLIQTPQLADRSQLIDAMESAHANNCYFTDEAQYMQEAGYEIVIVNGERDNIKITSLNDIAIAECITRRVQ